MQPEKYLLVSQFYQEYAAITDQAKWEDWLALFSDDCTYKIQSRENYDRNLPMATLSLTGIGMLKDRIYGITETIFHDPYHQLHIVNSPLILSESSSGNIIESQANYSVYRTKNDGIAEVFNVGRYLDRLRLVDGKIKIESRLCIFDNDMILNSLIYPI
ncbi:salicylate hydroxylase [Marinomonas mediterranea]|uniref:aromatic-ring-hydroxylating dioxygenase subunit beta n=1 Tax=Marinomonas mediterranea TaxID=119864 RepID=UPI00234A589F|nr:aromatic-ring-hydroxylating dioxygenase subunit beta [Marinomonas mediterranea]WCN13688.1 salicylate hydroxylase [Marinomonas mediterranea]